MNVSNATTVQLLRTVAAQFHTAFDRSLTGNRARQAYRTARSAVAASRLTDGAQRSLQTVKASWLFRWLTDEPEPDVVVIDLRETVVVGPVLAVLDGFFSVAERGSDRALTVKLYETVADLLRARPIQMISVASLAAVLSGVALLAVLGGLTTRAAGLGLVFASLALAGSRVTASWEDVTDSRLFEVLVALLEPPKPLEPPEERESGERDPNDE